MPEHTSPRFDMAPGERNDRMRLRPLALTTAVLAAVCAPSPLRADVKPNSLISDGMVLQQKQPVRVWGTADPEEKITVQFRDVTTTTQADKKGDWSVSIATREAGGPFPMTIAGNNKIELKDVYVGEVWVCSGQSNMEWSVNGSNAADKESAKSEPANPMLRVFNVKKAVKTSPVTEVGGKWVEASPETVGGFSAAGYFFARELQKKLKVPIGLIHSSWGGTRAEAWTSARVLKELPNSQKEVAKFENAKPKTTPNSPSVLYNGMIAPLLSYKIKGVIWYQGESNAGRAFDYQALFSAMIQNWRADWHNPDMPFYFVQLAPFGRATKEPGPSGWAELREAQRQTALKLPHTGMAVITDLGHEADIHPTPKQPVGERLALLAEKQVYGLKVEADPPEFVGMKVEGNKAVLSFKGSGLETLELVPTDERKGGAAWRVKEGSKGAEVRGFTVAGSDSVFHNAQAKIEGNTVVIWSDAVAAPVAVRYGWANHPIANLFGLNGLPVSPFRTDDLPYSTAPKK
jgi:sialate O-acetylesterase